MDRSMNPREKSRGYRNDTSFRSRSPHRDRKESSRRSVERNRSISNRDNRGNEREASRVSGNIERHSAHRGRNEEKEWPMEKAKRAFEKPVTKNSNERKEDSKTKTDSYLELTYKKPQAASPPENEKLQSNGANRRRSSSSSSDSSESSSDHSVGSKVRAKQTSKKEKKEKKKAKKEKKRQKKLAKKLAKAESRKKKLAAKAALCEGLKNVASLESSNRKTSISTVPTPIPKSGKRVGDIKRKLMAPMTKEEWDKRQSVIRREISPTSGRIRVIKGDGEILEEIVSKDQHRKINKAATNADGEFFQKSIRLNQSKK